MNFWQAVFKIVESFNKHHPGYGLVALALLLIPIVVMVVFGPEHAGSLLISGVSLIRDR